MTHRRALGVLTALIVAAPFAASPALAASPPTTVTITVTNPTGDPVSDIQVYALQDDAQHEDQISVLLGSTNTDGTIAKARGVYADSRVTPGQWQLAFSDTNEDRDTAGTSYALANISTTLQSGDNVQPTATMQPGARIVGTATAPSGKKIKNLVVEVGPAEEAGWISNPATTSTGSYAVNGLTPGDYYVAAYTDVPDYFAWDFRGYRDVGEATLTYGQSKTVNVSRFRVRCIQGLSATSPKKGTVKLVAESTAPYFGLPKPGGRAVIYRNGRAIKSFAWTGSRKTITLANQAKGKKISYRIAYSGGDCLNWTSTRSVKVTK